MLPCLSYWRYHFQILLNIFLSFSILNMARILFFFSSLPFNNALKFNHIEPRCPVKFSFSNLKNGWFFFEKDNVRYIHPFTVCQISQLGINFSKSAWIKLCLFEMVLCFLYKGRLRFLENCHKRCFCCPTLY